jgi:hypothetical protein
MTDQPPPPTLYHYTTSRALHGILSTGEIWFSDIRFLNDKREFHHACGLMSDHVRHLAAEYRNQYLSQGCHPETFDNIVSNLAIKIGDGDGYLARRALEVGFPFVFSLSSEVDSLGQWRAYGNAECCIEFDTSGLLNSIGEGNCPAVPIFPREIQYVDRDVIQRGSVVDAFSYAINKFFIRHLEHIGGLTEEVVQDGVNDFRMDIFFSTYKDIAFKNEGEWRMIAYMFPDVDNRVFFDSPGRYLVPRAKISFQPAVAIKSIMFGPEADEAMARASMDMFNRRYKTYFEPTFSKVPYRSK